MCGAEKFDYVTQFRTLGAKRGCGRFKPMERGDGGQGRARETIRKNKVKWPGSGNLSRRKPTKAVGEKGGDENAGVM